jgi:hypothetical protein
MPVRRLLLLLLLCLALLPSAEGHKRRGRQDIHGFTKHCMSLFPALKAVERLKREKALFASVSRNLRAARREGMKPLKPANIHTYSV